MGAATRASRKFRDSRRVRENERKRPSQPQPVDVAVKTLKTFKSAKFDETVELAFHLGIDPKQADQAIRGSVALPNGIGQTKRVVAFCQQDKVQECLDAGALKAGGEDLVAEIEGGFMDFDVAIASPDMMRVISKLGRVLGPKGLMPSPKAGTVTPKVAQAVKEYAAGKVEYRNDKSGNIHTPVGKMSFSESDLTENINAMIATIEKLRPSSVKGKYVKKIALSGTMTPSVILEYAGASE
jgi:large subunit ribosomal protein L1